MGEGLIFFSRFELSVGAKGGSLRSFLRASPDVGLKWGMGLEGCQIVP